MDNRQLFNRLSMRAGLGMAIVSTALLAMVLVFISGKIFADKAMQQQRASLQGLLDVQINVVLNNLERQSRELVLAILDEQVFLGPFMDQDSGEVSRLLDSAFTHYLYVSGQIQVKKVYAYSNMLVSVAESTNQEKDIRFTSNMCKEVRRQAQLGLQKGLSPEASGLCGYNGKLYFATVIPVGSPVPVGFIQVVSDPLSNLIAMESEMHMPMRITAPGGEYLYSSAAWPQTINNSREILISNQLSVGFAEGPVTLSVVKDIQLFNKQLGETSYLVMVVAAAITILTILAAFTVLQKTVIDPLQALTNQLRRVRQDSTLLGQQISVAGNAEVFELGEGFNEMTAKLRESYKSLEHMAFTDPLTKLPNRALFHDRLEQAIMAGQRKKCSFAVLVMDLDRFKEINDTLGHHVGDLVLQQVGIRLKERLRISDTVARLGGDEFAMLLQFVEMQSVKQTARNILETLGKEITINNQRFFIGASIGIAMYPEHGDKASVLLQRADVAMYAAKNAKAGFKLYDAALDAHSPDRLELVGELQKALGTNSFRLYYQPKINLTTGYVEGVEALVRWERASGEIIGPDVFIPILEQRGQIRQLTEQVLREAIRQWHQWKDQNIELSVAVNLSTRDLHDSILVETIAGLLTDEKMPTHFLELEVTESAVMLDPVRSLKTLEQLSAMGIALAIDDFGTGYSSLSYLKRLPAKTVKIDKSFVLGMENDSNDTSIVRTSIELAHNMGMKVTAEGVETKHLLKILSDMGCDAAQGYFIGKPMPVEAFAAWLQQAPWGLESQQA